MKKILLSGLVGGVVLLLLSYAMLYIGVMLFPHIAEEYYNTGLFRSGGNEALLFYLHPFIFSFAIAWFWERFKGLFTGNFLIRGLEVGLVYGIVALLPSMWMTYSALNVSLMTVVSWYFYGVIQSVVAGEICARMNP